jgi:hypothetical protein
MIRLPAGFVAIQYDGYFWHIKEGKLYSLKRGSLKPLAKALPCRRNFYRSGYQISNLGKRRFIDIKELRSLTITDSIIPMFKPTIVEPKKVQTYALKWTDHE